MLADGLTDLSLLSACCFIFLSVAGLSIGATRLFAVGLWCSHFLKYIQVATLYLKYVADLFSFMTGI
jgi:hypothetical protein